MKTILVVLLITITTFNFAQNKVDYHQEIEPEYPGGESAMINFLSNNFVYPEHAKIHKEHGRVFVEFVIDTSGLVKDIKIIKGVSDCIDAEAKRVIALMPKWKPGEQDGKKVKVRYIIPISVQVANSKKKRFRRKKRKQ